MVGSVMVPLKLIISYFIPHVKKYKWSFLIAFLAYGIGFIGISVITPLFYREIVDVITGAEDRIAVAHSVIMFVVAIGVTIVLYNIMLRMADYAMVYSQSNILRELHNHAFKKLMDHSYQFFANTFQGSLVAKARRYVHAFEVLHDSIVFSFWHIIVQLTGVLVVLFLLAPLVAGFLVVWCVFFFLITIWLVQKKRPYDLKEAAADSRVTARLADAVTNVLNIKMFASRAREMFSFAKVTDTEERARRKAQYFNNVIMIIQASLWAVLEVGGIYFVIVLWINGDVSAGTVVLVQTYIAVVFGSMWELGRAITNSMKALSNASEMVEIFETPLGVIDQENTEVCKIEKGRVAFESISFAYGEGAAVFENFSLTIKAGEKVGLVGHSGVGKTTITKLLLRFADIRKGVITIDGQDISHIAQEALRGKIAYVPQDPILFHRSLRENIAYAKPDATDEEIIAVSKKAHTHEFISKLPHGYDTLVGERGIKLSGGERQRVAVARAMLKDAPVLVLDEATSSLDSISEQYVQDAFAKLMEGKTTVVVAHRLSTVQKMDRIIVLGNGRIVEEGTHKELLDKKGTYYDFWTHQSGGFIS